MNWLKSAAGEFLSELSSDFKEIGTSQTAGGASPKAASTVADAERNVAVTTSQAPRPPVSSAAKSTASLSRPAETPVAKPPPVVARPLAAEEEVDFDWDDSGDEAEKPVPAEPTASPVQDSPQSADAGLQSAATAAISATPLTAATDSAASVSSATAAAAELQNSDGWADDDDLVWPDDEAEPAQDSSGLGSAVHQDEVQAPSVAEPAATQSSAIIEEATQPKAQIDETGSGWDDDDIIFESAAAQDAGQHSTLPDSTAAHPAVKIVEDTEAKNHGDEAEAREQLDEVGSGWDDDEVVFDSAALEDAVHMSSVPESAAAHDDKKHEEATVSNAEEAGSGLDDEAVPVQPRNLDSADREVLSSIGPDRPDSDVEAVDRTAALEQRVLDLERQLHESKVKAEDARQQVQKQQAEASSLREQLKTEKQRGADASKEVERLSGLVHDLERRYVEQAQAAELNAANSQQEVMIMLRETKARERELEDQLREMREAHSAASGSTATAAAEMEQHLRERDANVASLSERLESESKHRAAAVTEAENLRSAVQERDRLLKDHKSQMAQERDRLLKDHQAQMAALRTRMSDTQSLTSSALEPGGAPNAPSNLAEVLESFSKALVDAQGKVLRERLRVLRGNDAAETLPAKKAEEAAFPLSQEVAQCPSAVNAAQPAPKATDVLDEEDVGWGSDDDIIP